MKVLGIDVGLRNMAHCILDLPSAPSCLAAPRPPHTNLPLLSDASQVLLWQVVCIATDRRPGDAAIVDGVLRYFQANEAHFRLADQVVIEQQPAARMRVISAALLTLFRSLGVPAVLQHAKRKLEWAGLEAPRTYGRRKILAVQLCREAVAGCPSLARAFQACRKRDDLADAFLHALSWWRCSTAEGRPPYGAGPSRRAARARPKAPPS